MGKLPQPNGSHLAGEGGKGVGTPGQPAEQSECWWVWLPAAGSGRRRAVRDGDEAELVGGVMINDGADCGVAGHCCPPFVVCGTQPLATKLEHIGSGRNYGPSLILNLLSSISLRSQIMLWV